MLGVPKLKFERMATSDGSVVGVMRPEPEASTSMAEDSGKLSRAKLKQTESQRVLVLCR